MSCNCGTSSTSTNCTRRYMRIDNIIFDKKYVSKLIFTDEYFSIFFKGDCKEHKFPLSTPKSVNQIAAYQLELNNCGDEDIIDMTTNDHSKLINLDLDDQHPISAITNLQSELDKKVNSVSAYWFLSEVTVSGENYKYSYNGTDPLSISLELEDTKNCAELFVKILISLNNGSEIPEISDDTLSVLKSNNFNVQLQLLNEPVAYFISNSNIVSFGFFNGLNLVYTENNTSAYKILSSLDVINTLNSDNYQAPLSASQGKVLNNICSNLQSQINSKASSESVEDFSDTLREKAPYTYVNSQLITKLDKIVPVLFDNLPSPATYPYRVYFVSDKSCLAISDGNTWHKIKLESF